MEIGMLWFDNDKKAGAAAKIERAARFYRDKYGKVPNLCFVHPSTLVGDEDTGPTGVEVRTSKTMLPNHFWIGVQRSELAQ